MYHEYGRFNGAALIAEGGAMIHKTAYRRAGIEWSIPNRSATKFRIGSVTTTSAGVKWTAQGHDGKNTFGRTGSAGKRAVKAI